jgi:hypothetical protein
MKTFSCGGGMSPNVGMGGAGPQFSISRLAMFVAHQAVISASIIRDCAGVSPHLVPEDQPEAIAAPIASRAEWTIYGRTTRRVYPKRISPRTE